MIEAVADIVVAMEVKILPYWEGIMKILFTYLSNEAVHQSVKLPTFSVISAIAGAIKENFF